MLALREFTKLLKDKKLSRFVSKASIESIPVKAVGRVEKIMQQVELINANKKIDNENESNLKNGIIQFLSVSLVGSKQFANPKVKQSYENIYNASKALQKLKAELTKKEKNKSIKQLFENYDGIIEEKAKLQLKSNEIRGKIKQIEET